MKTCPTCTATYGDEVRFCPRDGFQFRGVGFQPGDVIRKKYEQRGYDPSPNAIHNNLRKSSRKLLPSPQ